MDDDYDLLLELFGDARIVLPGEASHGAHEFHRERARITGRLIEEEGFPAVAVAAEWPDACRVTRYVRGAGDTDGSRSHWGVSGPAGAPIEWDAVVTRLVPNEVVAWRTEPGAVIQHAGIVRFEPVADGQTRIDIRLSYNPGAGAVGHVVASLFGVDPKQAMDDDLVRFKSLLETGRTSARGDQVTREEVSE
jgi:uncharacterized membrane protein